MNPKLFFSSLLFSCLLFSCSRSANNKESHQSTPEMKDLLTQDSSQLKQQLPVDDFRKQSPHTNDTVSVSPVVTHIDWDKKIIRTASVKVEVKDFKQYNDAIHKVTRQFGGYIAEETQNMTDEKLEIVLSIKVPVDQFEPLMNELPSNGVKVLERNIASQDVTGETVDIKSRLEAKKEVRLKYVEFLKASKNMGDILKVQAEINSIQEEMEAAAGRIQYLSHQSAFSTINLTFYQPAAGFKPINENPSFFVRVVNAGKTGAEWMADLLVALISIWPVLLIIAAAVIAIKKTKHVKSHPQNV